MRRAEREMVRDALAEAVAEYEGDQNDARRHTLQGMRYVAGLLGMPEGSSAYDWEATPADRETRRRAVLRTMRRRARGVVA